MGEQMTTDAVVERIKLVFSRFLRQIVEEARHFSKKIKGEMMI
ncbi:MAG: hypothetical protein BSOLF_1413 [Candidatus Carbobacillus altaicus]|uniref:Uncharacterized protein n=1 Tax=Candidatus Carbonibacillus altaicus TaxID=2163959 RepID=A0A2R6XZI6_9BACL|nr:MAG: hypothetical protein BSOLF_1413 [Candidatus Carbobacillus altaicus]